jgi:hypothetical protein
MKPSSIALRFLTLLAASAAFAIVLPVAAAEGGMADMPMTHTDPAKAGSQITVTGEVLDLACYLDHGAHGEKHASCAKMCISSGLPVGLKSTDGTVYLLVGEHKPANEKFADLGAKTVTVKGKLVTRDGINLLENVEIVP